MGTIAHLPGTLHYHPSPFRRTRRVDRYPDMFELAGLDGGGTTDAREAVGQHLAGLPPPLRDPGNRREGERRLPHEGRRRSVGAAASWASPACQHRANGRETNRSEALNRSPYAVRPLPVQNYGSRLSAVRFSGWPWESG
jgi:hypothetical protein